MTKVTIVDKEREQSIAQADLGSGALAFEGNYYFDPDKVNMENLVISDRIYTCPYKGYANWIDLKTPDGTINDVAWVYYDPKPSFTHIKGRIGFYSTNRAGTIAIKE